MCVCVWCFLLLLLVRLFAVEFFGVAVSLCVSVPACVRTGICLCDKDRQTEKMYIK